MDVTRFEWDPAKDLDNQIKHGVDFAEAQLALADPNCVIALDLPHSIHEDRYYCFGRIARGIVTVRFTFRSGAIRIIGAGFWRKGKVEYERQNSLYR